MSAPKKIPIWIYWYWCRVGLTNGGHSDPFIKTAYSTKRRTAKQITSHEVEFGGIVGKVHRIKTAIETL